MQYLGGKARIAKKLAEFLESVRKDGQLYIEPFLGGCNVLPLMAGRRQGNEINKDLIMLYEAVRDGWLPPKELSEDEYENLKNAEPSALRGFAGIACSFSGKWFGGYARDNKGRNYCLNGYNNCVKLAPLIQDVKFWSKSYLDMKDSVSGALIYCDPPYAKTTKYKTQGDFSHDEFWDWCRSHSQKNDVYISEYVAPDDFECVWSLEKKLGLRTNKGGQEKRIEKLFKYAG